MSDEGIFCDVAKSNKEIAFEYFIDVLRDHNGGDCRDFSTVKLLKLLFLTVGLSSSEEELQKPISLINIFNKFVAMPFGPVESDIYNYIQLDQLTYQITPSGCTKKNDSEPVSISQEIKELIDNGISYLLKKNPEILHSEPFELVEITHKWSCWQICFEFALRNGKKSFPIPPELISRSVKYYR